MRNFSGNCVIIASNISQLRRVQTKRDAPYARSRYFTETLFEDAHGHRDSTSRSCCVQYLQV